MWPCCRHGSTPIYDGYVTPGNAASFTGGVDVQCGETIDFAVGYGNGTYQYDSTRLEVTITPM